jgi:Domain of unknown function DUF29
MPDGLYERDVLAWSEHQADLLRRTGRGERVNDVDWLNVADEIEGVGLSELHSVESFLDLIILHLLKINASPDDDAAEHWHAEIDTFQGNAKRRFTPSMRHRIDLADLYAGALERLRKADRRKQLSLRRPWPEANPFTLDQLLNGDSEELVLQLSAAGSTPA